MDFFERWFNVAPDGGNGTAEALWIAAFVAVIIGVIARRRVFGFARQWFAAEERGPSRRDKS